MWIDGARGDLTGLDASTTLFFRPEGTAGGSLQAELVPGATRDAERLLVHRCPSRSRARRCAASPGPVADPTGGA